ncbi:MAG: S46 family peptidase [Bacteroidales bacterium]|nr:S46 family peptidase [Bacteroidales bacterium]
MKTKLIFFILLLLSSFYVKSNEGMWLPLLIERLNYTDMQKMGLNLTPEEIYSINNSSLKDAIVSMSNKSSGTLISPDGLILTSHNFAFEYLQANSTVEKDYIKNGFWAMNKNEELTNPGLTISLLVRIENVTNKIYPKLKDEMPENERQSIIKSISQKLVNKAINKTHYNAKVKSFFNGKEFYLFVYETFRDVRLVGAPPVSIGRFGGDIDNWMWPRHTADFSLFRIYTSPDGKPADISEKNIPYKSKYHLPISLKGVKENDFSMILGYPVNTDRYLTSYGVKFALQEINPAVIKVKEEKMNVIKLSMYQNAELKLKYATKYANNSNLWKYYIGQSKQLKRFKVCKNKKLTEEKFQKWFNSNSQRKSKYGNVLKDINDAYDKIKEYNLYQQYFNEIVINGTDLINFTYQLYPVYKELKNLENTKQAKNFKVSESLRNYVRTYVQNVDIETDKKLFVALFSMFYNDLPNNQCPEIISSYKKEYNDKFEWFANAVYSKSLFTDRNLLWPFIDHPDLKVLENDIAFKIMLACYEQNEKINNLLLEANNKLKKANRLYLEGLQEMEPDKKFYPNANSTMRLSYGKVIGYSPTDGLISKPFTTFNGVLEKEDSSYEEFIVPKKLIGLLENKDFGDYSDNKSINVCFITDNDVTGGSSGSPVINGDGQITGISFDNNWESMSSDFIFEEDYQRTINVDIRYVLFIIDKYAGAKYIIDEMSLVKN